MRFYASYQPDALYKPRLFHYYAFPSKKARQEFQDEAWDKQSKFLKDCKRSDVVKACGKNFEVSPSEVFVSEEFDILLCSPRY